jgi:hypothetical protein
MSPNLRRQIAVPPLVMRHRIAAARTFSVFKYQEAYGTRLTSLPVMSSRSLLGIMVQQCLASCEVSSLVHYRRESHFPVFSLEKPSSEKRLQAFLSVIPRSGNDPFSAGFTRIPHCNRRREPSCHLKSCKQ